LLAIGGIGFVSAVTNLAPRAVAQMYEHWIAGKFDEALEIHYGLHPLVDLMFVETNPAPIKSVLARAGHIDSPMVRPPLVTPNPDGTRRIDQLLAAGAPMLEGRLADLAATVANSS
jgi:4-hydroxy-tetrahydrodipicolinate synthase